MVDYPNIFAAGMDAFDAQTKRLNAFDQQRASKQAGAAIASGDYTGGANVFNQAGMVDQAHNVLADQQVLQDRQTKAQSDAADRAQKAQQIKLEGLSRLTDMVASQQPGTRVAFIQQHMPLIQQLGVDPSMFSGMTEDQLTDQSLAGFKAALGKAKEDYTVGGVRYNGASNKPVAGFAEFDPKKAIYAVGDGPDAAPAAPSPQVAPTPAPIPPTTSPDTSANAPRSVRNNNPLNLTTLPNGQWNGQSGADGRFAVFSSPEAGMAAADQNLLAYNQHHGINTLSGIINRWAPAGDGANDPKAYVQTVAQDIGVDPNQPLNLTDPKVRAVILHSMAKVEGGPAGASNLPPGSSAAQGGQTPPAASPAPAPAHIPGFHAVQAPTPEWQDMADGRQRNILTGKVEGTATAADDVPLTPEAVKLLAGKYLNNGSLPPMGMGKTGTRNRDLILNEATNQAKALGLDANDLIAGTVTGKAAAQAMGKVTSIRSQVEASEQTLLKNGQAALTLAGQVGGPSQVPVINRWIQAGRKNLAGDPQVAAFNLAVGTVADEYAKAMTTNTGSGGQGTSDSARQEAYRRINTAMTPQQLDAVIKQMKIEIDNRTSSLRDTETGLRNVVRNGGQAGGMGSPAPVSTPAPAPPPPPKVIRYDAHGNRVAG